MERINKKNVLTWVLIVLSFIATVTKILVGFDVDEGYAVALAMRLLEGDKLFLDMWEIHQTSGLFAVVLVYPFLLIAKSTTGLVLYIRIVCSVIHFFVSYFLYKVVSGKENKNKNIGIIVAFIFYNFLPKWMMSVDFSMEYIWFITITYLCLYLGEQYKKEGAKRESDIFYFLTGIALALLVLGYPSMLVMYPTIVIYLLIKKDWRACVVITLGCVILAICFFLYLFSFMSMKELIDMIPQVFSDGSHKFDGSGKWILWIGHIKDVLIQTLITMIPAVICAFLFKVINKKTKYNMLIVIASFYMILTSVIVLFANVFGIAWGPFRLQIRYIIIFVLGFFLVSYIEKDTKKKIVTYFFVPALVSFLAILLASNVGPTSSSSYLILGVIGTIIAMLIIVENSEENKKLVQFSIVCFLLSLIACKGYYVRVSEYPPSNILERRVQIEKGPVKGIYVYEEEANEMMAFYDAMLAYTTKDDYVLYLGTQAITNLYTEGKMVLPTTISTPAFNEQWITYFELHETWPTVIVLSKSTIDNQEKFFAQNPFGMWIANNYNVETRIDTDYLCVIK